jgi:holo-[acyl-carrier protein] synthase
MGHDGHGSDEATDRPAMAVGVDLVAVDEVQDALSRFGDRYLRRVFTDHEVACATGEGEVRARHLAARFAAKEATMKALGPSDFLPAWRSIEVRQEDGGRCTLRLSGHAAELAGRARLSDFAVSMSHEGNLAAAVVFAVGQRGVTSPAPGESEQRRGPRSAR